MNIPMKFRGIVATIVTTAATAVGCRQAASISADVNTCSCICLVVAKVLTAVQKCELLSIQFYENNLHVVLVVTVVVCLVVIAVVTAIVLTTPVVVRFGAGVVVLIPLFDYD